MRAEPRHSSTNESGPDCLETETSEQAEVGAGPGDHRDVDREVNRGEISGKITDARLMVKS